MVLSLITGQGQEFPVELDGKFYYDISGAINHTYSFKEEERTQNLMLKLSLQKILEENKFYAEAAKKALLALLELREKGGYAPVPGSFLFFWKETHPLIKHVRMELKKWTPKKIKELDYRNAIERSRLLEDELTTALMTKRREDGGLSVLYEQSRSNEQRLEEKVSQLNAELEKRNSADDFEKLVLSGDQRVAMLKASSQKEISDLRDEIKAYEEGSRKTKEYLEQKLAKTEAKNEELQAEIDFLKEQQNSRQENRQDSRKYGSGGR